MALVDVYTHPLSLPRAQQAARNYAAPVSLREIRTNKELKIKEIIYDSTKATRQLLDTELLAKNNNAYSYKLMPPNVKLSGNDILIFDGKVVIIEFKKTIESVVLQSDSYYNNFKELFDFIWQVLPESKR